MRRALGTSPIGNHWLEAAFLCIHQHEGSWRDQGLPYFGGLQMDLDFQRAYGRDYLRYFGTADRWPMSVQLAVAIRGYISRGFRPGRAPAGCAACEARPLRRAGPARRVIPAQTVSAEHLRRVQGSVMRHTRRRLRLLR